MKQRPRRGSALAEMSVFDAVATSLFGYAHLLIGCRQQIVEIDLGLKQHGPYTDA